MLLWEALDLLVGVPAREGEEEGEVGGGESREEPVEEVESAAVEVVDDPALAAREAGDAHDAGQQHGAQEVADADGAQENGGAQAAHGVGRLVVEELERADRREHLGRAQEHVLRQQDEYTHRHRLVRQVQQPVLLRNLHHTTMANSWSVNDSCYIPITICSRLCWKKEKKLEREEGATSAFKVIFKDMTRKLRIDGFV